MEIIEVEKKLKEAGIEIPENLAAIRCHEHVLWLDKAKDDEGILMNGVWMDLESAETLALCIEYSVMKLREGAWKNAEREEK